MLEILRARFRRRRGRFAVLCLIVLLSGAVAMAHSSVADHHMGEAAAMCMAIVVGTAAVAALPSLRARPPVRRAVVPITQPASARFSVSTPHVARGDPALLQVFRR